MQLEGFPFKSKFSFDTIISFWEQESNQKDTIRSSHARNVLSAIKNKPNLTSEEVNSEYLRKEKELLELIFSPVLPSAIVNDSIMALFPPFSMDYFYGSNRFFELMEETGGLSSMAKFKSPEEMILTKVFMAYQAILSKFYNIKSLEPVNFSLNIVDKQGFEKIYRLDFNPSFCDIKLLGELPKLTPKVLDKLIENPCDISLWSKHLPFELFEFSGFGIYQLQDVTNNEVINSIKEILLKNGNLFDENTYESLEDKIRSLLRIDSVRLGFYPADNQHHTSLYQHFIHRRLSDKYSDQDETPEPFLNIIARIKKEKKPLTMPDIEEQDVFSNYKNLITESFNSAAFIPATDAEKVFGVIAVVSNEKNAINTAAYWKVEPILPLLNLALKRNLEELNNQVQNVIKANYTSIHPAVEWRFTEAALTYLRKRRDNEAEGAEEIIFKDVYPLYAASDIRNSSVLRNNSIREDLTEQLKLVEKTIEKVNKNADLPVLGELSFKASRFIKKLNKGLYSGDESSIVDFIKLEVDPIFRAIAHELESKENPLKEYWKTLDKDLKIVFNKRKKFEESLNILNDKIAGFLDQQQVVAQKAFPHFFEKYKTDGVEYNMYIGQSLTKNKRFHKMYLKNLKLWQLLTTVEIARISMEIKEKLPLPLEMTHLILAHDNPLSIRFRMDEKQFDVDGAYNMRYEILKKRIDKVHIKGTTERLTQPGKIAIVYNHASEAEEYASFIEYLQEKHILNENVENLELEDLQGVYGLKALRVSMDNTHASLKKELASLSISS